MIDLTDGKLGEALEFARKMGNDSLQKCLDQLTQTETALAENGWEVETIITTDFAPYSFGFVRRYTKNSEFAGNGGIIYHGPHDNFGSGGSPTFSVCLSPTDGWSIHT
jgi:hypothetical protein